MKLFILYTSIIILTFFIIFYVYYTEYFTNNNNFGCNDIYFFKQNSIPSFTYDGKIIMQTEKDMCLSANGNGDMYYSLISSGILK